MLLAAGDQLLALNASMVLGSGVEHGIRVRRE